MLDELMADAEERMGNAIEALGTAFARIRTGRAHPSILDSVMVDYYGSPTPLRQVANINVEDARTLAVIPWEKPLVPQIEKAIMKADLGLNPSTSGEVIRIPMPMLTEETRKTYIRKARQEAESSRVAVRNARRDLISDCKELLKEKDITEDEDRAAQDQVQKITDKYIAKVDAALVLKEKDLMEI